MSKKKSEPKRYEIDSLEKLLNVINNDNYESITTDFLMWLGYCVEMTARLRKEYPDLCKDKTNTDLLSCYFIWIDDGKHDFKSVEIKNKWTGEVTTLEVEE